MEPRGESAESNHRIISGSDNYGHIRRSLSSNDIVALKPIIETEVRESKLRPTGSIQDLSEIKFVSVVAETMYQFQEDTPSRFRSTGPNIFKSLGFMRREELSRPQSSKLKCENRSRRVHHMTKEEREPKELEKIKNKKIKANPIPKSVLEGTNLPEESRKPIIVLEPLKLTEINKKTKQQLDDKVQSFKDSPPQKQILQHLQVPTEIPERITKSCSPKLHYQKPVTPVSKQVTPASLTKKPAQRHSPVKPIPFSFEKRHEHLRKLKEEKIKKQIEEERKLATQFKASPVPEGVKKRMRSVSSKGGASTKSDNKENNHVIFKAKSPVVLQKEPFKPVLQPSQAVQPVPFQLATEKRATEREKFNRLLKKRDETWDKLWLQKEYEIQKAEEQATAELRAKQVHRAKPAPLFVPEKTFLQRKN